MTMNRAKKSFMSPTAKPCDVEYRLRRLRERLSDAHMFLTSIDPSVFPEDHKVMLDAISKACLVASSVAAPAKKARKSEVEKAQAAAERQAAKEAAALKKAAKKTAREQFLAHQKAEKAGAKKLIAEKVATKKESQSAGPAPTSAIERALAAAKARKAQRVEESV